MSDAQIYGRFHIRSWVIRWVRENHPRKWMWFRTPGENWALRLPGLWVSGVRSGGAGRPMSRFRYVKRLVERRQREALDKFVSMLFEYEPQSYLYRFRGGADLDGASRMTSHLLDEFKRLAVEPIDHA